MSDDVPGVEFEEVEAMVIQEGWSSYELEDRSIIKARSIMTKLRWPKGQTGRPLAGQQIVYAYQNIVVVLSPSELRGAPNPKQPNVEEARLLPQEEARVVRSNEEWNIYELPLEGNKRFKMKTVATSIRRVKDLYADDGNPYYIVESTLVVVPVTSPS